MLETPIYGCLGGTVQLSQRGDICLEPGFGTAGTRIGMDDLEWCARFPCNNEIIIPICEPLLKTRKLGLECTESNMTSQ